MRSSIRADGASVAVAFEEGELREQSREYSAQSPALRWPFALVAAWTLRALGDSGTAEPIDPSTQTNDGGVGAVGGPASSVHTRKRALRAPFGACFPSALQVLSESGVCPIRI